MKVTDSKNTLSYYDKKLIMFIKGFIVQAPSGKIIFWLSKLLLRWKLQTVTNDLAYYVMI